MNFNLNHTNVMIKFTIKCKSNYKQNKKSIPFSQNGILNEKKEAMNIITPSGRFYYRQILFPQ